MAIPMAMGRDGRRLNPHLEAAHDPETPRGRAGSSASGSQQALAGQGPNGSTALPQETDTPAQRRAVNAKPPATQKIITLKKRSEFLRLNRGRRSVQPGVIVLGAPRKEEHEPVSAPRIGFTVTKKRGNAVRRNRIKRRLRAAAQAIVALEAHPGFDYVLIGRSATATRPFAALAGDLQRGIRAVTQAKRRERGGPS